MRPVVKHYVEAIFRVMTLPGPVYEFGSLEFETPTMPGATNFRELVTQAGLIYVGCDMQLGPGVDSLQNLHALDLPDASVGTVICADTLEHVEYPRQAIAEIYRVLKPDGVAIFTTVMNFLIHSYPEDYWRFTPKGLESLLSPFEFVRVDFCGKAVFPRTVTGIAIKGACPVEDTLNEVLSLWSARETRRMEQIEAKYRADGLM